MARMFRTFEYDDYPMSARRFIRMIDDLKSRFPHFRCSVFAIPGAMTERYWHPLRKRRRWVEVCPHGIVHQKRECREPETYGLRLHYLDMIAAEKRYTRLFKAPWHGLDHGFCELLRERDYEFCIGYLNFRIPFPTPDWRVWSLKDARSLCGDVGLNVESHAIIPYRARWRNRRFQQIDKRNIRRFTHDWLPTDRWQFVSRLTKPLCKKVYLGCGPHVADDWDCLDPRTHLDPRIIRWEYPEPLPYMPNRVDIVLTAHMFNYLEPEWYEPFCADIFRVLRPGGLVRLQEDKTESGYTWRKPGQPSRKTGTIRSEPRRRMIVKALRRAGFTVRLARPGKTQSPHKDVIQFDNRLERYMRSQKTYLEGVKPPELESLPQPKPPRRRHLRA